jgi:hypothetical protein
VRKNQIVDRVSFQAPAILFTRGASKSFAAHD